MTVLGSRRSLPPDHRSLALGHGTFPRLRRGFTLLEILLVLALIGLLASVLIGGSSRLLADRPVTVEGVFWQAAATARRAALQSDREVRLRYDGAKRTLVAALPGGETTFPLPEGETRLDFLAPESTSRAGLVLIGGVLTETRTLPAVTFYPDGTCSPFRVQVTSPDTNRIIAVDPWTASPALVPATP